MAGQAGVSRTLMALGALAAAWALCGPALADDAAPIGPASLVDVPENGFRRLFPEPRDGAADGVEHDEFRLFHRAGGNVRRSRRGRHGRERLDGAGFRMMLFRHVWT